MTWDYWISFGHIYLTHVGAWGTLYGFMSVKDGKTIHPKKILGVALFLALFSSTTHNHYLQFLK